MTKNFSLPLFLLLLLNFSCKEMLCEKGVYPFCEEDNNVPVKPGTFTQRASGPAGLGIASFVIGNKAYVGAGGYMWASNTFQSYDPSIDKWASVQNMPDQGRFSPTYFSTSKKGYVGGGYYIAGEEGDTTIYLDDLLEFDPNNNSWSKSDLPLGSYFTIGDLIYTFHGSNLKVYNSFTKKWITKKKSPIGWGKHMFTIGICAYLSNNRELWEYNSILDKWSKKASLPDVSEHVTKEFSFSAANKGYIVGGKIYEYNPKFGTWTYKTDVPHIRDASENGYSLDLNYAFGIGNKGYICLEYRYGTMFFLEYDPNE